jgi:hypothetical protein
MTKKKFKELRVCVYECIFENYFSLVKFFSFICCTKTKIVEKKSRRNFFEKNNYFPSSFLYIIFLLFLILQMFAFSILCHAQL